MDGIATASGESLVSHMFVECQLLQWMVGAKTEILPDPHPYDTRYAMHVQQAASMEQAPTPLRTTEQVLGTYKTAIAKINRLQPGSNS